MSTRREGRAKAYRRTPAPWAWWAPVADLDVHAREIGSLVGYAGRSLSKESEGCATGAEGKNGNLRLRGARSAGSCAPCPSQRSAGISGRNAPNVSPAGYGMISCAVRRRRREECAHPEVVEAALDPGARGAECVEHICVFRVGRRKGQVISACVQLVTWCHVVSWERSRTRDKAGVAGVMPFG